MPTETDMRLRSWLDGNQREREQMCRAVLALDPHYSNVRPRHPSGGPDGGRDIEAIFEGTRAAFGAVGFANSANDSRGQKAKIRKKFSSDLASARAANPELKAFAFLTNVHFTMGEQDNMKREALASGLEHCDVLDRERLRVELDSPSGFFIRFHHLSIPLSEAEQASFLSKYGSQIQDVVTTGFQKVEKALNRLVFLAESNDLLEELTFRFVLKKPYAAAEIGHFRSFVFLALRERRPDTLLLWFGSSDGADRFRTDSRDGERDMESGVGAGIATGQWEQYAPPREIWEKLSAAAADRGDNAEDLLAYKQTLWSSGVGRDPVPALFARYRHADTSRTHLPSLALRELDEGMFLPFVNAALAVKIHSIQIYANGYKLQDLGPDEFRIDDSACAKGLPGDFAAEELADAWVRLRPASGSSTYYFRFGQTTPRRLLGHEEPTDSPPPPELRPAEKGGYEQAAEESEG